MASIDDLFKKSGVPSKRKHDSIRDPNESYKSGKRGTNGHSNRQARVEEEEKPAQDSAMADAEDADADQAPPSGGDDLDEPDDDDEEGRFFGGGITAQESEMLELVDELGEAVGSKSRGGGVDGAAPVDEVYDAAWVRRASVSFERKVSRNAALRAKHASDPTKFIASEADLDAEVRGLSVLASHPELYGAFAELGGAARLVGLLAHENTDVAVAALECVGELTDEDVAAEPADWDALVDAMLEGDLLGLLVANLGRLDEGSGDEVDRSGVYYALGIVENLCSRSASAEVVGQNKELLGWLVERVGKKEDEGGGGVSQNKQYAAEVLAIVAQASAANRRRIAAVPEAVDKLLQLVAIYRRSDPGKGGGGQEEEYMADLFEALTCVVDEAEGKMAFLEAEGVELCLIMIKEGKMSKALGLRLLDHAVSVAATEGGDNEKEKTSAATEAALEVCRRVVEAGGLKTTFTMFMKPKVDKQAVEHLLNIFTSLLRLLPADSAERIRTLAKFVEKDYEKLARLAAVRETYAAKVDRVDAEMRREREATTKPKRNGTSGGEDDGPDDEIVALSRRLDAGFYLVRSADVILAWLLAEDVGGGSRKALEETLQANGGRTLKDVKATLGEQLEEVDDGTESGRDFKAMLETLTEFV